MKRYFLKIWPYLTSFIAGILFYLYSLGQVNSYSNLLINIAATFFVIPLLYFIYELSKNYSQRKLNVEIFDYAKMRVDKYILSLVIQIIKLIYPYGYQHTSLKNINHFLSISSENLSKQLSKNNIIGFQVFKDFSDVQKNIEKILENPFIINRLIDGQIISIIELLKSIRSLESVIMNVDDLYIVTNDKGKDLELDFGSNISKNNKEFPDRHLLLQKINDKEYKVLDFADIIPFKKNVLLNICKLNEKYLEPFSKEIYDVISNVNNWLNLTNQEFVVDTKHFKFSYKDEKWEF